MDIIKKSLSLLPLSEGGWGDWI